MDNKAGLINKLLTKLRSLSLSNKIIFGFSIPVLLTIINSSFAYRSTNALIENDKWVSHTHEVIAKARLLEKLMLDMQTGKRGFIITGQEHFLEPYFYSKVRWNEVMADLSNQVSDNPPQVEKLRVIDDKAQRWLEIIATAQIKIRKERLARNSTLLDLNRVIDSEAGKTLLDELRELLREFINVEERLKLIRQDEAAKAARNALLGTVIGTFIASILAVIVATILLYSLKTTLREISKATKSFAEGKFNENIIAHADDEVGELAESFNNMASQLSTSKSEMDKYQERLKATARDLEEKNLTIEANNRYLVQAQKELKTKSEKLEETSRFKSDFLATMSHEIRTPMNGVLGMLGLLQNTQLSQDQLKKLKIAKNSADSLLNIIDEILDYSKIEAGKLQLELIDFNLRNMLGDVAESMAVIVKRKDVEIILDVTKLEHNEVIGDPGRLKQILINLIGNAVKFTNEGEIVITASTERVSEEQIILKCAISDTGIGIPEEKLGSLFESFKQADTSTTRKYGGTGLGLAICKKLCELMQGSMSVSSVAGKGSEFSFQIKLVESVSSAKFIPAVDFRTLSLLIVDDNDTNRVVVKGQLERWGAEVTEAASAKEAIKVCQKQLDENKPLFDIAILDMQMPEVSGMGLARNLKSDENFKSMSLVLMTSIFQTQSPQEILESGIDAYFSKPTTPSDLHDAICVIVKGDGDQSHSKKLITQSYIETVKRDSPSNQRNGKRILLVEDNIVNQQVAEGILEEINLEVSIAENGKEALEALKQSVSAEAYSLILMDCQMPEMDGYEASRRIRQGGATDLYVDIPIVAMTANAMEGDKEKCIEAGMSDYVSKPIDGETLINTVGKWLDVS